MTVSDTNIIEVLSPQADSQSANILHYPIRLLDIGALWELDRSGVYVEASCRLTGQVQKIAVRIKLIGQKSDTVNAGN